MDLGYSIKRLTGIILFPVAVILAAILFPISFVAGIILEKANKYLFLVAYGIDLLGNAVCGPLFNHLLIKQGKNKYSFGNPIETISYVIAVNKKAKNLTRLGKFVDWILNIIDPGHTDLPYQKRQAIKAKNS